MDRGDISPILVVHGGAGVFTEDRVAPARAGCLAAVAAGLELFREGGSALDAALAAVRILEDDPTFNAGVGAVLNRDGIVEVDAAVMDGDGLRFGGIAAVPNLRRPIDLARAVMDDGEQTLLAADGAWTFAREHGFEPCDPATLITELARNRWRVEQQRRAGGGRPAVVPEGHEDPGTVGACAIDARGHVASATSTGGITWKRSGRVGDTPLCGCGTYADDEGGAASATGHGESITRVTMTRVCVDLMRAGASATEAAWQAVSVLANRVGGQGGIICCDTRGRIGAAHNSARMAWGAGRLIGDQRVAMSDIAVPHGADAQALLGRSLTP
jgi:beta-aspartyl-peptidase (threonine type)